MRIVRGLGALLILLAALLGVPALLVLLGGNPFPSHLSGGSIASVLLRPDDGSVLRALLVLVGWLAWLIFAVSVAAELVGVLTRQRLHLRLPGLGGSQRLAGALVVAVLAMAASGSIATPHVPAAGPVATAPPRPAATRPVASAPGGTPAAAVRTRAATPGNADRPVEQKAHPDRHAHVHVVESGDDLWSLAEHYYGHGREWRKIAEANPDLLTGGPDRLEVGWRLTIPGAHADPLAARPHVVVREGDTLSSLARHHLGHADRWPELYHLNREQIEDPNQIDAGMELRMPAGSQHLAPQQKSEPTHATSGSGTPSKPAAPRPTGTSSTSASPTTSAPAQPTSAPTAGAPTAAQPTSVPTVAQPTHAPPPPAVSVGSDGGSIDLTTAAAVTAGLAGVGGMLAAGLIAGFRARRRHQLQTRPVGRRIASPPPAAQLAETVLGARQQPLSRANLDQAVRAVAVHCRRTRTPLPTLLGARIEPERIELLLSEPAPSAPVGFEADGNVWRLSRPDARYLESLGDLDAVASPYPALVAVGEDGPAAVLIDLETAGLLTVDGDPASTAAVLSALALELSFGTAADELVLTVLSRSTALPEALGKHNVTHTDEVEAVLSRLEVRAARQRMLRPQGAVGQNRIEPDLADPWAPEILLVDLDLTAEQRDRLTTLLLTEPRVTVAAVLPGPAEPGAWQLQLGSTMARLEPLGWEIVPQQLDAVARDSVVDLVATTGSEETTPAPWWAEESRPRTPAVPVPAADEPANGENATPDRSAASNVTYLGARFGGWTNEESATLAEIHPNGDGADGAGGASPPDVTPGAALPFAEVGSDVHHPTLQLLGPIGLLGAAGEPPGRAAKQCLEYCGWILEHPGTTAQAMAAALAVAEGTRRSNMSRLRSWLGTTAEGEPFLPDAYSGRIVLHPAVSSDWQRLRILIAGGVNRTSDDGLSAALRLVRGAPLADAAPGQWHWAEELRTDMASVVRDIGVELSRRALAAGDLDTARWAAARSLAAAPEDELLMTMRIRTEHRAGNAAEVERLVLQVAATARTLGLDLDHETVRVMQEAMEGRVRARLA